LISKPPAGYYFFAPNYNNVPGEVRLRVTYLSEIHQAHNSIRFHGNDQPKIKGEYDLINLLGASAYVLLSKPTKCNGSTFVFRLKPIIKIDHPNMEKGGKHMGLIIILLILAIIAAIFGFGGVASAVTSIALILFWIFLALFVISLIVRLVTGRWLWF
jgi:uncharacterized membrane protein YtjA (UPF0391 family)